jgi:hypothetical protein
MFGMAVGKLQLAGWAALQDERVWGDAGAHTGQECQLQSCGGASTACLLWGGNIKRVLVGVLLTHLWFRGPAGGECGIITISGESGCDSRAHPLLAATGKAVAAS